jgi:hypothetical protein
MAGALEVETTRPGTLGEVEAEDEEMKLKGK